MTRINKNQARFLHLTQYINISSVLLGFIIFGVFFQSALAEDVDVNITGQLNLAAKYTNLTATDLIDDPEDSGYDDKNTQAIGVVNSDLKYQRLRANSQLRFEAMAGETEFFVDEAYGELLFGESAFLYGGIRILSYGQSYGLNPVDFLHDLGSGK